MNVAYKPKTKPQWNLQHLLWILRSAGLGFNEEQRCLSSLIANIPLTEGYVDFGGTSLLASAPQNLIHRGKSKKAEFKRLWNSQSTYDCPTMFCKASQSFQSLFMDSIILPLEEPSANAVLLISLDQWGCGDGFKSSLIHEDPSHYLLLCCRKAKTVWPRALWWVTKVIIKNHIFNSSSYHSDTSCSLPASAWHR